MNIEARISNVIDTTAKITFTDNNKQSNASSIQFILNPASKIAYPLAINLTKDRKGTVTAEQLKIIK